jgi:hypothetical protein
MVASRAVLKMRGCAVHTMTEVLGTSVAWRGATAFLDMAVNHHGSAAQTSNG